MGLLNAVCRPADLRAKAEEYAHRITANGPFAVRKTKESVLRGLAVDMHEAYRIESEISKEVFASDDAKEGPPPSPRSGPQLDEPVPAERRPGRGRLGGERGADRRHPWPDGGQVDAGEDEADQPVRTQKTATRVIHVALIEPAAANAPDGLEAVSTMAQMGTTMPAAPRTSMMSTTRMSGPKMSPSMLSTSAVNVRRADATPCAVAGRGTGEPGRGTLRRLPAGACLNVPMTLYALGEARPGSTPRPMSTPRRS